MRTTITIDDHLLAEAKAAAARSGRTLNALVEDALRVALASQRRNQLRPSPPIPTSSAKGWVKPGVNLDSNAELLDLMEEDEH